MVASLTRQLTRAEEMLAEVSAAEGAVADNTEALRRTKEAADKIIKAVRERIIAGETTGDLALDLTLAFACSAAKDEAYEKLSWLIAQLRQHPGELILQINGFGGEWLGIIAEDLSPCQWWESMSSYQFRDQKLVIPTVAAVIGSGLKPQTRQPWWIYYRNVPGLVTNSPPDTDWHFGHAFAIGDEAVEQWAARLGPHNAADVWINSRRLGRPIGVTPEVIAKIQARRETALLELVKAENSWRAVLAKFKRWQDHPAEFLAGRSYHYTRTETGITIDFGLSKDIERTRGEVVKRLDYAINYCLMTDSERVLKVAADIGYELPGDLFYQAPDSEVTLPT